MNLCKDEIEGSKSKKPPKKRIRYDNERVKALKKKSEQLNAAETFHFIGYVPVNGKVWELDGLKNGPIEVGDFSSPNSDADPGSTDGWEDVVRPALRMKMERYGAMVMRDPEDIGNIRFNLLALVPSEFEARSDALRLLIKEKNALEERLTNVFTESWKEVSYRPDTLIHQTSYDQRRWTMNWLKRQILLLMNLNSLT